MTNSIAKETNSIGKPTNLLANSIANGINSTTKVRNY